MLGTEKWRARIASIRLPKCMMCKKWIQHGQKWPTIQHFFLTAKKQPKVITFLLFTYLHQFAVHSTLKVVSLSNDDDKVVIVVFS